MRKNQKGFTLVELIIAIAILAIVTLAVCGFIVVGSRSYTSANTDIMLQQDAQLAFNQISDVIIDTTDSISYGVRSGGAGDMQLVLKDSEYAGEATEKCLIVVNKQEAGSLNDNKSYWFYWNKEKEIIYFNEVEASSDMSEADIRSAFESAADMNNVSILAQHVQEFSVDISQFEENRVVMLSAVFANGNREYVTSNNVTVRNRIALNQVTVDPMTRAEEFTINVVNNIILEPGDFFSLSTIVDVQTPSSDSDKRALKWELVGGSQNDTTIVESSGDLRLGIKETRTNFAVKVSRANEEYAGQNDRVSKTIIVNVKRATAVNISGPSTAKQGETVNLTGAATGNLLGVRCEACPTDVLSEDDDLITSGSYNWHIIEGSQYGSITNQTVGGATLQINADATPGAKIRIQAASKLSATKNGGYGNLSTPTVPPVTGTYEITIEKKASSSIPLGKNIKFGTDNDPGIYDYIRDGVLPTENGRYVFCIRIREENDPNWNTPDDDWYWLYLTSGANMRFAPDMFGLDITKNYKVYLQALYPIPIEKYNQGDTSDAARDSKEVIWEEYHANLDSDGKYVGSRYFATDYYEGSLNPPAVVVSCNGVDYPNDSGYTEVLSILGGNSQIGAISLDKNQTINVFEDAVLNNLRYTIYKEDANGQWKRLYGYGYDTAETPAQTSGLERIGALPITPSFSDNGSMSFGDSEKSYYTGQSGIGHLVWQPGSDPFLKDNVNGNKNEALGKYHIVVGFVYANNPNIRNAEYSDESLIKKRIDNQFGVYFYKQWNCVINVNITTGLNLHMYYDNKDQGWISFPLPTDSSFPFNRQSATDQEQTVWGYYELYTSDSGEAKTGASISNPTVKCSYDPSSGAYRIQLKKEDSSGNKGTVITDYGTYEWSPGSTEWKVVTPGAGATMGADSKWGPLIYYNYNGQDWMMEVKLPSQISGNSEIINNPQHYPASDLYGRESWNCLWGGTLTYTKSGDEWTLVLKDGNGEIGKWTCKTDGKQWNVSK